VALGRLDETSAALALRRVNEAWRPPGRSRARLSPQQLAALCDRVRTAQRRWRALAPGAQLIERWPLPVLEPAAAARR
jgi:hypothetical protein